MMKMKPGMKSETQTPVKGAMKPKEIPPGQKTAKGSGKMSAKCM